MAFIAGLVWWGVIVDVVLASAAILTIWLLSRRGTVEAGTFHQPEPTAFVRPKRKKKRSRR